jgi:predicted nucleic acid-binding protein
MFYLDTSVIVAYYCPEALSEKAEDFLMAHTRPAVSSLGELEMFSAVSRKIREGDLNRKAGSRIIAKFLSHLGGHLFKYLPVEPHHYRLARDWMGLFTTKLKTLDALHLAIASSNGLTLVTADRELSESGKSLAIDVMLLEAGE